MVNTSTLTVMLGSIFVFYTLVGLGTAFLDSNLRIESDLEFVDLEFPNASQESTFWFLGPLTGQTSPFQNANQVKSTSLLWDIASFRVFGLPAGVGLFINGVITIFTFVVTIEVLKLIRGV